MTGLVLKTLYNYRHKGIGPPSTTYRRKVIYKLTDVKGWVAEQLAPVEDPERLRESRPPEPRQAPVLHYPVRLLGCLPTFQLFAGDLVPPLG